MSRDAVSIIDDVQRRSAHIHWPGDVNPDRADLFAHNDIVVNAPVAGAFGLLLSLWIGAVLATNRLIVTAAGLVRCSNLRRRFISWAEIQSVSVALGRAGSPVVIRRNDGSLVGTNIGGIFTRRYQVRVADELADWQRKLAPARPS